MRVGHRHRIPARRHQPHERNAVTVAEALAYSSFRAASAIGDWAATGRSRERATRVMAAGTSAYRSLSWEEGEVHKRRRGGNHSQQLFIDHLPSSPSLFLDLLSVSEPCGQEVYGQEV